MVLWQSPPLTEMTTTAPLTGAELKAKVAELGQAPENELALACGYVNAAGRANIAQFKAALLEAHEILKPAAKTPRRGRSLGFEVTAGPKGQAVLSGGYTRLIGIEPGDAIGIQHIGNSLVLTPAGVVPLLQTGPMPALDTYDSAGGI